MVLKCAQVILAVILIFSDIAYAIVLDRTSSSSILSPPSRFSPIVTLEWQDDHYVITENAKVTPQLDNAKTTFPEDAAFIYINLLINQFLQKLSVLGKLGVSQGGLQAALEKEKREHLDLFIKCINDHSPATRENFPRFHFNEMSWNGNAIVLPYSKKDPGSGKIDTAYLYYSLGAAQRITNPDVGQDTIESSSRLPIKDAAAAVVDMDREKRKAGDFWDELILRTEEAKRNKEILILGLDTSWIQNQAAAQPIISRMNQLPEDLRRLGLDNLVFKYGNGSELASQLAGEKDKTKAKFSNIIVIGSREIIREDRANEFSKLKGATPEDRALLIGVDPSNLTYMSGIRILEMWLLALKLHSGIVPLQSNTDYINIEAVPNREGRVRAFIFTPVKPYDIIESARINRLQIDEINTKA
jgi:hypothetical protein